jgi:hypothetical protein
VVNALLTQIDKLSRYPNVLVLTTSNITGAWVGGWVGGLFSFLLSCRRGGGLLWVVVAVVVVGVVSVVDWARVFLL